MLTKKSMMKTEINHSEKGPQDEYHQILRQIQKRVLSPQESAPHRLVSLKTLSGTGHNGIDNFGAVCLHLRIL